MNRHLSLVFALALGLSSIGLAQDSDSKDKNLDVRSSLGDLHVGSDADAKRIGVPLYPGARLKVKDNNNDQANLSILTDAFGMKLLVASYLSNDSPGQVLDFYRDKLKKYGKVLECHSPKRSTEVDANDDKDSAHGKELKCDEKSGPVTELKVGTEDNQRVVAVEAGDGGKGSDFSLVYLHTRGKSGDI
jgi:hypothetical protein